MNYNSVSVVRNATGCGNRRERAGGRGQGTLAKLKKGIKVLVK